MIMKKIKTLIRNWIRKTTAYNTRCPVCGYEHTYDLGIEWQCNHDGDNFARLTIERTNMCAVSCVRCGVVRISLDDTDD